MGKKRFDPGVRGVGDRAIGVLLAVIEVAADVAAGNADRANQGDHGVCEILADPISGFNRFINRRVDPGAARHVIEIAVEARIDFA